MNFPVSEKKQAQLLEEMKRLGVLEKDIEETFSHSSGAGGQNVNKVATCVHLKYFPLKLSVKCQQARTQGLNRYYARKILLEKIAVIKEGRQSKAELKIAKIKKQKKRRRKKAKVKSESVNRSKETTKE